jgi:hypothetical protein
MHTRPQAQSLRAALQNHNAHSGFNGHQQPAHGAPATHFPQDAFRHLNDDGRGSARQSYAPQADLRSAPPPHFDRSRPSYAAQDPNTYAHNGIQSAWPPQNDPAAYDLAHYSPGNGQHPEPAHDPYGAQQGHFAGQAADGWNGAGWNQGGHGHDPHFSEPMPAAFSDYDRGGQAQYADDGYAQGEHEYAYEDEAEDDGRSGRRGSRSFIVAAALVGAIGIGGGLAYTYKALNGKHSGTPVVKADQAPSKAKPSDPGGKDIAYTDKKFLNRLGDDKGAPVRVADGAAPVIADAAAQTDSDGGPRKVTTLTVNRDGSMTPPNPVPQNSGPSAGGSGVPGLVLEGLNGGGARPQPQLRPSQADPQPAVQQQAPVRPKIVARAEPTPEPIVPAAAPKKPIVREETTAAQRQAPVKTASAAAAATSVPITGSGFVPVLSSQKSRMDALKVFADIQQKYSDVLSNHTPDEREVNLGEKGVWHRLMLGPPGSREAANTVCTQLKAAGYAGCWITAY